MLAFQKTDYVGQSPMLSSVSLHSDVLNGYISFLPPPSHTHLPELRYYIPMVSPVPKVSHTVDNSAPRHSTSLERNRSNITIIKISWFAKSPKQDFC